VAWCKHAPDYRAVFSLIGRLLQSSGVSSDGARDASELLNDVHRMLLAYYPPIDSHALHVYESAVATMPECALFATVDNGTAADVHLISERQGGWTATLCIIKASSSTLSRIVTSLSFSPDGTQLASISVNSEITLWSVRTGSQLAVLEMVERHSLDMSRSLNNASVAYSPDGTRIVSSFSSPSMVWLALWETKTYQQLAVLRDPRDSMGQPVTGCLPVSFLPGSSLVVFGCDDGTISVWDTAMNTITSSFRGGTSFEVWDQAKSTCVSSLGGNTTFKVLAIACSPDGSKIVSGLANGILRVSDSRTGAELATLEGHSDRVNSIAFSPNGAQLVSGSDDRSIRIWDMRMNKAISVMQSHSKVMSVAFSPDGGQVVSGSSDKTVRIWDVQSTKQIIVLQGHHKSVFSVSFSPDGALVVSGSADNTLRVWDIQTPPRSMGLLDDSTGKPTQKLAISLNGARLVSIGGKLGRVWDMQTGQETSVLDGHTESILVVAFSPDSNGLRIVTGSRDNTVRVWNTQTGQELARFSAVQPSAVALSADGTWVVAGLDNGQMPVWDVLSGEQLALFVCHRDRVLAVALSPDGSRVVSSTESGTARLWDVASGDHHVDLIGGRDDIILAVAFSPDGLRVVSGSYRGLIQVWDTITGEYVALAEELNYSVTVVARSLKNNQLYNFEGRELRITCDCGDIMIYQHDSTIPRVRHANATQSTASRIGEADLSPIDNHARSSAITCDETTGWLFCSSIPNEPIPLCWLPVERRGPAMICGHMVAVGGTGGKMTMLDFTTTIKRLQNQGIIESP
jgi:WD40 repeat protein